ncbi:hypothetical protein CHUAL_004851 [Chamberlinius hualienensis]
MAADNLSVVLKKVDEIVLENRPIPTPKSHEVLIAIKHVGICGSDVHYWKHGRIGSFGMTGPMVLGHEPSGVIVKVGSDVTNLKPGDRVAIEPGVPCMTCNQCLVGRYNLCPDMVFCATPPYDGTLCRFFAHHAAFTHKIPDHVSLEEAALVEPLAVAVHACRRSNVGIGKKVLVTGAGPIGLVNLMTAKAMGAHQVVVIDIVQNRLDFAKKLGADHTVLSNKEDTVETITKKVIDLFGGEGPDITLECSGAEVSLKVGCSATKAGGVVVGIGLGPSTMNVPFVETLCKEVDIRGIFRYANCHPTAIELIATGKVNVKSLITHRFPLEESVNAFEVARTGAGGAVKVLIQCDK